MARKSTPKRSTGTRPDRSTTGSSLLKRLVATGAAGLPLGSVGAEALVARGLAVERDGRLYATETGQARAVRDAGGPEPFFAQHRAVGHRRIETGESHEILLVDLDESPLTWLARRKGKDGKPLLTPAEVAAGEKLRADFTRGQMSPRVTANWEASVASGRRGGGVADLTEAAMAARMRVSKALEAVGPELSGALIDVCCFLKGVAEVERDRGWPARGAKLVLGLALTRLARHYGLSASGTGGGGRIVSWGTPDHRPTIDGA